jgi:uncharacterized membrane protein
MSFPSVISQSTVLGLQVGSTAPAFLAVLAVHVPAGLVAVISGAAAALSRKGTSRHVAAGRTFVWAIRVVAVTAAVLAVTRWPQDAYLAVLALVSLSAAAIGQAARRRTRVGVPAGDRPHVLGMGISYVALLTAFYVDNGPHLPIWDRLPVAVFWVAPAAIGTVLITRALRRRPGRRQQVEGKRQSGDLFHDDHG